jgi:hypothetical protein
MFHLLLLISFIPVINDYKPQLLLYPLPDIISVLTTYIIINRIIIILL